MSTNGIITVISNEHNIVTYLNHSDSYPAQLGSSIAKQLKSLYAE